MSSKDSKESKDSEDDSEFKRIFKTVLPDRKHFPSVNQAHFCWQKYNEYVLCLKKNGGDEDTCAIARHQANSICPEFWLEEWDEQRAKGVFLGVQEHDPEPPDSAPAGKDH